MHTFRLIERQHQRLMAHLHDGSGLEAVSIGVAGRGGTEDRPLFVLHDLIEIPHDECDRKVTSVTWPTRRLRHILAHAAADGLAVVKFHSHPFGMRAFSARDDRSDAELYCAISLKVPGE